MFETSTREIVFTAAAGDMLNLLANLAPFTSKDQTTPVLNHIQSRPGNDDLTGYATDRYRLARVTIPAPSIVGDLEGVEGLLMPRAGAESLAKVLKGLKKDLVTAKFGDDVDSIRFAGRVTLTATVEVLKDRSVTRAPRVIRWELSTHDATASHSVDMDSDFPRLAQLFPDQMANDPVGMMAFDPEKLATFAKVKDYSAQGRYENNCPLRIIGQQSPNKPVSLFRFNWFEGLLMPVRMPEQASYFRAAA
ncbi:hypothetical protein [Glutamicibacter creatinolyticus]|uniref:hypothetical protein n=1 Tax=Glutamicibacter creatinolyticus TaxID=162496 RepID=UPI003216A5B5